MRPIMNCILTDSLLPGQPGEMSLFQQELTQRPNRRSPKNFTGSTDVFAIQDTALTSDDGLAIDLGMFPDPDLASD